MRSSSCDASCCTCCPLVWSAYARFGFLANRVRKQKLELCRVLPGTHPPSAPTDGPDGPSANLDDPQRCPICQVGRLMLIELFTADLTLIQDTS
jgi:hypothetical protein